MTTQLKDALEEHLATVVPPRGDVDLARRAGTARRRRRHVLATATAVAVLVVGIVGFGRLVDDAVDTVTAPDYPALGRMDFSEGLRAYADPGRELHMGGRTFPAKDLDYLDTDATATPFGVVFYDKGRPLILGEDGEVVPLVDDPVQWNADWHPGAKVDSVTPQAVFATLRDGVATITVRDLQLNQDVDTLEVACGECGDLVLDALDDGVVLYRTAEGTFYWEVGTPGASLFAGPETRVADVRGPALIYSGPAPTAPESDRYIMLPAAVDATLTYDGKYVLDWSSTLRPTRSSNDPVVLEQGPADGGLGFWAIDTDGSVLVAALTGKYPRYTVFDCEVPSGACEEVGPLVTRGGDPMFIGVDM